MTASFSSGTDASPEHAPPEVEVDVGGAFTDFVVATEVGLEVRRVPTTDPQRRAVSVGIGRLDLYDLTLAHPLLLVPTVRRHGASGHISADHMKQHPVAQPADLRGAVEQGHHRAGASRNASRGAPHGGSSRLTSSEKRRRKFVPLP